MSEFLSRLTEALEHVESLMASPSSQHALGTEALRSWREVVDAAREYRRLLVEGEPLWFCEEHNSPTGDRIVDSSSKCCLALEDNLWVHRCRMVERRMIDLPGENE